MSIDRDAAQAFAWSLGHSLGRWERQRLFMDDLFLPANDPTAASLPAVWVLTCGRCGALLVDEPRLAPRSDLLAGWCPWLLILIPERRVEAATRYEAWWRSLGYEPLPWNGGDEPPPGPAALAADRT